MAAVAEVETRSAPETLYHVRPGGQGAVLGLEWAGEVAEIGAEARGFTVGQDFSIGYLSHDATSVQLYLEESFTFQVIEPRAAVHLAYAD